MFLIKSLEFHNIHSFQIEKHFEFVFPLVLSQTQQQPTTKDPPTVDEACDIKFEDCSDEGLESNQYDYITLQNEYDRSMSFQEHANNEIMDELLKGLQTAMQENNCEDLADDLSHPLVVIGEDAIQTEEYPTPETVGCEDEVEQDPTLYPGSRRHLGVAVLLLCCFMIRYRLSQDTKHYLLVLLHLLLPERNCLVT